MVSQGWLLSIMCFCRAYVAQQGLLVVPNGSTLHSYTAGDLSLYRFLHRKRRSGLSSGRSRTWWNMPQISLLMATKCSLNLSSTARREGPKVGPGSRRWFRLSPLNWKEQLKTTWFFPLCWTMWCGIYQLMGVSSLPGSS